MMTPSPNPVACRRSPETRELQALGTTAPTIAAETDLKAILQKLADTARQAVGAEELTLRIRRGACEGATLSAVSLAAGARSPSPSDRAGRTGLRQLADGGLAIPLRTCNGARLGLIKLSSKQKGAFDAADKAFAAKLAQLAAPAVEAVLERRARQRGAERLRVLSAAMGKMLTATEPTALLANLLDDAGTALDIDHALIYDADEANSRLRLTKFTGAAVEGAARSALLALGKSLCDSVAGTHEALQWRAGGINGDPLQRLARLAGIRGVVAQPVKAGRLYGVLAFAYRSNEFGSEDLPFCGGLAHALAAARERLSVVAELQGGQRRLQIAQHVGRFGTFEWTSGSPKATTSPEFCRLLGLEERASYLWSELAAHINAGDLRQMASERRMRPVPEMPYQEFRFTRPDTGETRWIARRGEIADEGRGRRPRYFGALQDVTDAKATEERLQRLNETLEARIAERTAERDRIWKLSTELMLVTRLDGRIETTNPAWLTLLGWREEELTGKRSFDFIHPDDLAESRRTAARMLGGIVVDRFRNRLRRRDGSYRLISWSGAADQGFIYSVGRDISKQVQIEEQLRQSQKMEAVGQLTGGIAHDFNNLLTGILGGLELLQRRIEDGRAEGLTRYIDSATASARRAAALTHRLLAFSRRQPLDPKPVDICALVRSIEELLRRSIGVKAVLETRFDACGWRAFCDAHQLENVLLNLAINSRDAMPEGGRLLISCSNLQIDRAQARKLGDESLVGDYLLLSIGDTGAGMSPEVASRCFEPFFTTKPQGQGTGLGLSMVYGFVKQSGGHIQVSSTPGDGTTVALYLPRCQGMELEPPVPEVSLSAPRRSHAGETILVVDDEPDIRMMIVEVLQELDYRMLEAGDAASALHILATEGPIDLLISDVGLPGGCDGRELAAMARQQRPDLKVLFITGYTQNAVTMSGFLEPGMELMTKPFTMDKLVAKVCEIGERGS